MNDSLRERLKRNALAKFDGDKRKAIIYLQDRASFFARKSDRYRRNPLLQAYQPQWSAVYQAYSGAAYALDYYLSLDEEFERESFDEEPFLVELADVI